MTAPAAPRFCKDCRFYEHRPAGYRPPREAHLCVRPFEPAYDVVTGDPLPQRELKCVYERSAGNELGPAGECGPSARFFEPRPAVAP